MKNTHHTSYGRTATVLSLGLVLASGFAYGEAFTLAAGASTNLTSETAETTTYDSMSIAGSLTVSGMMTVQSTGTVTVAGGAVTVSGDTASIGNQGKNIGSDWNIASDGKIVINNGKQDFSVGADGFAILDSCEGQDDYIDFMEINGGGFCPWYMDNNAAAKARIKVSGTAMLRKATGPSYGGGSSEKVLLKSFCKIRRN